MLSLPIRWTIGRKLQLLVFITLLPAFLVSGALSLTNLYQRERLAIQERASRQAESVADRVDSLVVGTERMLIALAEVPAMRERDVAETGALLRRLRPQYRYYDNLMAIDPAGYIYASAQPMPQLPLFVSDREYLLAAMSRGGLTVSNLLDSPRNAEPGVLISYPVWDVQGQNSGLVTTIVEGQSLQSFLAIDAPQDLSVTIVSFDGQIIARTPDPGDWVGRYISLPAINPGTAGRFSGVWEGTFLDSTQRVVAYHTALRAPWRVFVGIPSGQAYAPLGHSIAMVSILFALTFAFALAIAIYLSRRIARPLRQLAAAARTFRGEPLPKQVPVQGEDEVAQLATAFNKMLGDLSRHVEELSKMQAVREADRLKSELLASVSHELKTPLGSIKGFASALQQDDIALDRETQRDFLATIEADADRLTRLVEDLLDMSRIEARALRLEREPCSIGELIHATINRVQPLLGDHEIQLAVAPDLPPIVVDPARIEQVLNNLLDNAIKYSPAGTTIDIHASLNNGGGSSGGSGAALPSNSIVVAVNDEGIGIPPEQLERVFERFWRAESGRRRRASGTGLGLAICKGIIQAHGGQIWAENRSPAGCHVAFTLPVDTSGATRSDNQQPAVSRR